MSEPHDNQESAAAMPLFDSLNNYAPRDSQQTTAGASSPSSGHTKVPRRGVIVNRSAPVVFLSIKPQWAQRILEGAKTVELRKFFSHEAQGKHLFLYATYPRQAIVGMARIDYVQRDVPAVLWKRFGVESAVPQPDFDAYYKKSAYGSAVCLSNVRSLPELALQRMREIQPGFRPPMSHMTLEAHEALTKHLLDLAEAAPR